MGAWLRRCHAHIGYPVTAGVHIEQWKVGRSKIDDGAILLVARDDRTVRIEVGCCLEGALNNATSKRIIDEIVVPRFRQGDPAGDIEAGVDHMMPRLQR